MILEFFTPYADLSLLILRFMVAAIFAHSGLKHLKNPTERAESIGMSKSFTIFLGLAEVAGALGLIFGVLTQWAALGLIIIMLGAIYKRKFVWKNGFWGDGWNYELMLIVMNLVILTTEGGKYCLY